MSKVNFWIFGFILTKRLNFDSFTNENWNKFKFHRSVVSRRKEKKTPLIKEEKNLLFSVYRDAIVWLKAGVEDPALGQLSNFFESAFYM